MTAPKSKIKIVGENRVQGVCSCGWVGLVFYNENDLSATYIAAVEEIQAHKHIPAPKKIRKKKEMKNG